MYILFIVDFSENKNAKLKFIINMKNNSFEY